MKNIKWVLPALIMLSLLFTGCSGNGGSDSAFTSEEVQFIAAASLGGGYTPLMLYGKYTELGETAAESLPVSGTLEITVSGSVTTFDFSDAGLDLDTVPDGVADVTVGGQFTVEVTGTPPAETITYTFNALSMTGALVEGGSVISGSITGTMTYTPLTGYSAQVTLTGIVDSAVEVILTMTADSEGQPTAVTNATIDGEDHTFIFNRALSEMLAD